MRKSLPGLMLLLLFAATPAMAQKIGIDYDKDADFDSYTTFAWAHFGEHSLVDSSPLMHSRIKNALEYRLTTGGMTEDMENPQLYVTYYTETKENIRLNTTNYGYGYGGGWHHGGYGTMGSSSTTAYTYETGTLIVDIWDAATEKLIWRGSASSTIPDKPEKVANKIDKMVAKMAKEWQKMSAKNEKAEARAAAKEAE